VVEGLDAQGVREARWVVLVGQWEEVVMDTRATVHVYRLVKITSI